MFNIIKKIRGIFDKDYALKYEVECWLDEMRIRNYNIKKDLTVDVYRNVDISENDLKKIPVQFGKVYGYFDCSDNQLISLKGCPEKVGGDFDCSGNELNSLDYIPEYIGGNIYLHYNNIDKDSLLDFETRLKKIEIKSWLVKMNIKNYTINEDLTVDVLCSVDLRYEGLDEIPIQFGKVYGDFNCSHNKLTSLKGCPKEVGGSFICMNNLLTFLEHSPKEVRENFDCSGNQLTSLEHAPKEVSGSFDCKRNKLRSLKGCPEKVGGNFECNYNHLTSLDYAPKEIQGNFICFYNKLTTLDYLPEMIGGDVVIFNNRLEDESFYSMSSDQIKQYNTSKKLAERLHRELPQVKQDKPVRKMKL